MLILREMPDLSTPAARDEYHRLAAEHGAIVSAFTKQAVYGTHAEQLSIKAAFGGREHYFIDGTRRAVDDDVYLIINHGHAYESRLESEGFVHSVAIVFSDAMLDAIGAGQRYQFDEHLRTHDRLVTPLVKYLASMCEADIQEPGWYEEHAYLLLERMKVRSAADRRRIDSLPFVRRRTRDELHRRILTATDYLLSGFAGGITLTALAQVACLDKFHFLRTFRAVHGVTPFYFLECKRIAAAARLLARSDATIGEVAESVGLGNRERLVRVFRETFRMTPSQFRHRSRLAAETESVLRDSRLDALLRRPHEKGGDPEGPPPESSNRPFRGEFS
jgi:AraC-like DNA-binding protein